MTLRRHGCWLLLALAFAAAGCNRQDTEALTRIGQKVQSRAEAVTGDLKSTTAASWHIVGDFGVDARVAARLRWDKELAGAAIDVLSSGTGVELRGKVTTFEQRRRAVMLAESTMGVEGVKDSLVESER
jgi:osmotically-inducible protein OsmY